MRKVFYKWLALILTLVFVFAFVACAPVSPDDETPVDETPLDETPGGETPVTPTLYQPFLSESLPVIRIKRDNGGDISGNQNSQQFFTCTLSTENCDIGYVLTNEPCEVRVRGNATANYEKKPFRIKFTEKQTMLGLNGARKYKNWVLLADYKDSSLCRNAIAFYLGNNICSADGYYTTDYRPVELYINDKYHGVYLLAEQQQINTTRVSINEGAEGYTGTDVGYFFEYDHTYYTRSPETERFVMTYSGINQLKGRNGNNITFGRDGYGHGYTIKSDIYDMAQNKFLLARMENTFKVAYEAVYNNKLYEINDNGDVVGRNDHCTVQEAVEAVIDVRSFVDMYLLQEICCDYDLAFSSFYLSLDMSGKGNKKLTLNAPWDFDSSLGLSFNPRNYDNRLTNKNLYAAISKNVWMILLINEDWFWDMAVARWKEITGLEVTKNAVELVGTYSTMYKSYYKKNFDKWPNSMGVVPDGDRMAGILATFTTQADAAVYLGEWLSTRIEYLDTVFV